MEDRYWGKDKEWTQAEWEHVQTKTRNLEGIRENITDITCHSKAMQEETEEMIQNLKILQDQVTKMEQ